VKPETLRLKRLLAELGIPRGDNTVSTGSSLGPIGILITDQARRVVVEKADQVAAAGYAVLLHTYRCGCPASVWLCEASEPKLKRTVLDWAHDCPTGAPLEPVTPIPWLDDLKREVKEASQ
jgi:hypothetical protein